MTENTPCGPVHQMTVTKWESTVNKNPQQVSIMLKSLICLIVINPMIVINPSQKEEKICRHCDKCSQTESCKYNLVLIFSFFVSLPLKTDAQWFSGSTMLDTLVKFCRRWETPAELLILNFWSLTKVFQDSEVYIFFVGCTKPEG